MEKLLNGTLEIIASDPWACDKEAAASMATELLALRADAETRRNHNAAVIDPLIAQLRDAGYTGTLSEMVGQACALQEATRWIPVEERLPEESGRYLVWLRKDNGLLWGTTVHIARWYAGTRNFSFSVNSEITEKSTDLAVTHWMPLPVTPEGGER